ncbi:MULTISPECIES: NAD(P)H-binding protein [unclassified Streptomyces]|uniref:NAD(P)H-binding protein n=1 Tax=unclassified Streptomyces TaxID=2593676 RepID=UPI0033A591BA
MILVTGATGTVGHQVARLLAGTGPVRILARDPARVTVKGPAVEVVQGSYEDRLSLSRALRGVRSVFLVTNDPQQDHDAVLVEEATATGVRRLVKLSAAAVADPAALDLITAWQRRNEHLVRSSGLEWTMLRPRSFMSNTLSWARTIRSGGEVHALYGRSRNPCVDPRDVAEVAVRALTEDGHDGRQYTLTGPRALSAVDQTAELAQALGRPLRFVELDPEQASARLRTRYPAAVADALMHSARRQLDGGKAQVERTTADLLGRPARSFRTWAADHAGAFA